MEHNPLAGLTLDQTSAVICEKCSNNVFTEGVILRKVSKFLVASVSNKDQVLPIPVFYCSKCQHVNDEFLPEALKQTLND